MVCLIFLLAVNIFGTLHTWGHFFDTLGILGAHSGTSEPSGIINHRGRALRGDSKTKQRCQKHKLLSAVFCSSSLHSPRDVNRLGWCFLALPAYLTQKNKCLDSYCMDWDCNVSSAVTPHSTSIQTHAHTLTRDLPKLPRFFFKFLLDNPRFKDRKRYCQLQSSWNLIEILALSPPGVCYAGGGTQAHGRGNRDEAGGGDGLSGIDPLCAHCAERQKDLFQPQIHGNRLWSSLIAHLISALLKNDLRCKLASVDGILLFGHQQ